MYYTVKTAVGLIGIHEINDAIVLGDISCLKELIIKYENNDDFKKGENLQHIFYAKALCEAKEENYIESIDYCMKGLLIENPLFTIETIPDFMYSNIGLAILNCISVNYMSLNKKDIGFNILTSLLSVIERNYINSQYAMYQSGQFSKKFYINALYNISFMFLSDNELDRAEEYINKGIEFSVKENNMRFLPNLIYNKFMLLYKREKLEEAIEYYVQAKGLYKLVNRMNTWKELEEYSRIEFPDFIKYLDDRDAVIK
jgi:tetratricopeptide (TPR) repeat protein